MCPPPPSDDLEQRLNEFEEAWSHSTSPPLDDYLPGSGTGPAYRRRVLEELIKIDLERRWSGTDDDATIPPSANGALPARPRLENYLQQHAELGTLPSIELIGEEYRVRQLLGDRPGHAEYAARFAQHGPQLLVALTQIDRELRAEFSRLGKKIRTAPVAAAAAPTAPEAEPAITSCADLLRILKTSGLLPSSRMEGLEREAPDRAGEPRALARDLLTRGWLTAYQVNQLFLGRVHDLAIGPYRVLERLGEGGAGQVFKARHQAMDRIVALKIIRRELLSEPEVVSRFYREIAVVGQLSHPNIVHAYDAGPIGTTHVLAMEYVEGIDLHRLVRESGPLPAEQACAYIEQAAQGLQYAHERGLVHRDIKPPNLLLTSEQASTPGIVKILDLGLARLNQTAVDGTLTSILTPVNSVMMGTPDYMAPEQAVNFHAADIRSDIYSLGCTLHYLLTGQPPFPGGNLTEKLLRHQQADPIDLQKHGLPREVVPILRRMLAKNPANRYPTPSAVVEGLRKRHEPGDHDTIVLSVAARGRKRWPAVALAVVAGFALLLLLAAKMSFSRPAINTDPEGVSLPSVSAEETQAAVQAFVADVSAGSVKREQLLRKANDFRRDHADGQELLRQELLRLRTRAPESAESLRASELLTHLPSPLDGFERKNLSPSERFDWQSEMLVGVLGEHRHRHWGVVRSVACSPDGKWLVSAGEDALIRIWDAKTNEMVRGLQGHRRAVHTMAFTADSKLLASAGDEGTVLFWDPATGKSLGSLEAHAKPIRAIVFSPDGKTLATGSDDWSVKLWDTELAAPGVTIKPRTVVREHRGAVNALTFLPGEPILASGSSDGSIALWNMTSRQAMTPLEQKGGEVVSLAVAGGKLFAGIRLTVAKGEVVAWDLKTRKVSPVQSANKVPYAFAVTPDGKTVAAPGVEGPRQWKAGDRPKEQEFVRWPGTIHAMAYTPDGGALLMGRHDGELLLHRFDPASDSPLGSETEKVAVAVSPDGRSILGGDAQPGKPLRGGQLRVWDVPTGQSRQQLLGPGPGLIALAFSWDGRLAAAADQSGALHVWDWGSMKEWTAFEPAPERHTLRLLAFAPNGRDLVAAESTGKGAPGLRVWDTETGRLRADFQAPPEPEGYYSVAFTRDSRRMAVGHARQGVRILDARTGAERGSFAVNPMYRRQGLVFADDDRTLAVSGGGVSIKLWDSVDTKELPSLKCNTSFSSLCLLAFGQGGSLIAVGTDGQIAHWPALSGDKNTLLKMPGAIRDAVLASDGRHLITANANGTIYVFRLAALPPVQR
jgi:serine/threonine-protein kinase